MKLVTLDNLKSFFSYMKESFCSPYAKRDDEGNEIKKTYLKKADAAAFVNGNIVTAEKAVADEEGRNIKATYVDKKGGAAQMNAVESDSYLQVKSKMNGRVGFSLEPNGEGKRTAVISYSGENVESSQPVKAKEFIGDVEGNATSASALKVPRTISINGPVIGATSFDGSKNISIESNIPIFNMFFRQPNTEYKVGDIVYSEALGPRYRLYCVKSGVTSSNSLKLDLTMVEQGTFIDDGGVRWMVEDLLDTTPVGTFRQMLAVQKGYALLDGSTVLRKDYPRLVVWVEKNGLWTDDQEKNLGLFGVGDGSATMVMPNFMGRFVEMGETPGVSIEAGLPNITGDVHQSYSGSDWGGWHNNGNRGYGNGALYLSGASGHSAPGWGNYGAVGSIAMDASRCSKVYGRSDTVQPAAIAMYPCIKC